MEFVNLEEIRILLHAEGGEIEPLARYIENGGTLGPSVRRWLADHLRGKHPKKRGNKRLWSQIERELRVTARIRGIQHNDGKCALEFRRLVAQGVDLREIDPEYLWNLRGPISENKAIDLFLETNPDMSRETVRTYLRKEKERQRERERRRARR
jgi:hypothetical protein